jgi:hypothetical protein
LALPNESFRESFESRRCDSGDDVRELVEDSASGSVTAAAAFMSVVELAICYTENE